MMKKAILTITGLMIALFAFGKESNEQDPKYGKGSVPVNGNGMVSFDITADVPQGMTDERCYELLLNWAKGRFAKPNAQASRILNEDAEAKRYIFHVDQMLVFKRTAMVVDETRIEYNFSAVVKDGKYTLTMTDIKYRYEEGRDGGGNRFTAEEWITDKEAYNKKGTKFLKSTGKFRIKTIDLKDILFQKAADALSDNNKD